MEREWQLTVNSVSLAPIWTQGRGCPGEGGAPGVDPATAGWHLFSCFTSKIEPDWVSLLSVLEGLYLCFNFRRVPVYVSVPE